MLQEQDRAKLDSIVQQMIANQESDNDIQFVVNDFKSRYDKEPQPQNLGIAGGLADITGGKQLAVGAAKVIGGQANTLSNAASQLTQNTNALVTAAKKYPTGDPRRKQLLQQSLQQSQQLSEEADQFNQELPTSKQIIGSAAKLGLTAATLGTSGIGAGLKGAAGLAVRAGEGAAIGAGFQAASNLEENAPLRKNLISSIVLGAAIPTVAKGIEKGVKSFYAKLTGDLPSRLINSDIKPLLKDLSYGKNPGRAVAQEGIVANNLDDLSTKISSTVKQRGEEIGQLYDQYASQVADYTDTLSPIETALKQAQKNPRTNAGIIERLQNIKKDLLGFQSITDETGNILGEEVTRNLNNLTPREGFQFKSDLGDLTKFTGNKSDDNFVNKALKATYHKIDSKLDSLVPGLEKANSHYADLLSAKVATEYRNLINERQNLISLVPKLGAGAAVIYGLSTGDVKGATEAILADIALASLGSTAAKTRIAALLARLEPQAEKALMTRLPILQRLIGR